MISESLKIAEIFKEKFSINNQFTVEDIRKSGISKNILKQFVENKLFSSDLTVKKPKIKLFIQSIYVTDL